MPPRPVPLADLWSAARARAATATRETTVVVTAVLLVGLGATQAPGTGADPSPSLAPVAADGPASTPLPETTVVGRADRPVEVEVPETPAPAPKRTPATAPRPPAAAAAPAAQVERWLPTGTGMWLHDWRRSEDGHASEVVARAKRAGLTHLFVQTGSSRKGWIGQEVLSQLMPATTGTDLKVIAWDFPKLDNPESDARRLARAAFWTKKGAPMVAAVAPDVETAAEGTKVTPERVRRYYTALRKALPKRTAILATVPWPSEKRTSSYPYGTTAPFTDAWIPMAYWYNRSPSVVTKTSMQWLARYGKPVMPVGQGYDGRLDAPYLKADPHPDRSVAAFAYVAREQGAQSISLWSWQTTGSLQWRVLADQAKHYAPKPAPARTAAAVPTPSEDARTTAEDRTKDKAPGRKPHGRPKG